MSNTPDGDGNIEFNESRIDALVEEAWNLRAVDPLQGLQLGERALWAARSRNYQLGLAKSLSILAACNYRLANYKVASTQSMEALEYFKALSDEVGESKQTQTELLRRNRQLAAAAEVARITTSTLDLGTLLTTSVEVIREKFNFYHASVFLVDPGTNMVVLEGSTGEAGRQLKTSHHQLAIGSNSLVGLATATGQPVVVQDVTNDPTHFKNLLLPYTQAEAVIPLLSGDVVVGALDVQSTFADAFSDSDMRLLITIADQLTVAIENARLYASVQKELAERKRAEQALQEIKDALEIRVQERTAELKDTNEQLQIELVERKQIEAQLEQSLSTLQATIESTTDGILVVDRDGKIASFNQRFVEMWRIPDAIIDVRIDDQVLAFVLDQLVDPDAFKAKVQELYNQPQVESFDVLTFKDGRVFERYSRPQQIAGQSVGRVWSFRDVTERKQAEDELRKSQESFERIVSTMKDVVYSVDAQTREFSYLGPAFEQLLGYSMEDIRKMGGRQAFLAQVITGDMFTKQEDTFEHLLSGKTDVPNWEEWWRCKDGTLVCLEDRSMPVYEDGHLIGTQGILRDVTERKQAERRNIVYSQLGQHLSLVTKPRDAARIIVEAADELLGWDACTVDLLSPIQNALSLVLSMDLIDGKRVDVTGPKSNSGPSPMELLVLKEGPQLILHQSEDLRAKFQSFGDHNRPSASILYVPIRHGNNTTSFLSIQSYTPNAYDKNDLDTLQFLADYCAGALDRIWAEEALLETESKYRGIFENSVVGIYQTSVDGRFLSANAAMARILGYESLAALLNDMNDIAAQLYVDPSRRKEFKRIIDEHDEVNGFESEIYRKDGGTLWVSEYGHGVRDPDGTLLYFEGVTEDITARKQAEAALQESEQRYAVAMQGANDGLWDWNLKTNEMYYSPRWKSMLGHQEQEVDSSPDEWFKRIHPDDISQVRVELDSHLKGESPYFESEHRMLHANGHHLWVLSRGLALRNERGEAFRMAGSQTDMTIRKQAEERLEYDALHDGLTGLPNRTLFLDRLEHAVRRMKRSKEDTFAVLFLDIDRFKLVNDSLGHAIGDLLLIEIGNRLKICLRPGDTVARLGGDEFAVILDEMKSAADATHVANRIQEELTKPFDLDGNHFSTSASIGITLSKTSYNNAEDLLRDADTAMYRAKTTGKARHEIFDKDMHAEVSSLLQLEADLRKALVNDEFRVYYQPLISMTTHKVVGTEALVRWQHPKRGLLPPSAFMTALEETGMIVKVGEWVLRTACEQNKIWQNSGNSQLRVAINFSARQFQIKNLTEMVRNVLEQTGMNPQTLELEITESTVIKDAELTLKILQQLHDLGVSISLDDFGSGYSALGYLGQYPFHALKADRSFITDIPNDTKDMAVTSAIIALAHSLRLKVVAEGVETSQQLEFLRLHDCDEVQGFLFSRPVPSKEMTKLLLKKILVPVPKSKKIKQAQPPARSKPKTKKTKK